MFEIDSERTSLPLSPDKVLALVASLNAPMVVAADMPVEPTRAYVCAYRDGLDEVGFSIYLHCVESNKGAFYRYDGGRVPQARFDEVMGEAMAFAESLGFMMDDLGFRGLDAARRDELMRETPMFLEPSARVVQKPAAEPQEPAASPMVDESADAGLVGATPISPIPETPAPPFAAAAPPPPAEAPSPPVEVPSPPPPAPPAVQAAAAPAAPLQTVFVPPPTAAPAVPPPAPARQAPSGAAPATAPAAPSPSPARPSQDAPQDSEVAESGAREIELTIDAPEPEPEPAEAVSSALPPAPSPAGVAPVSAKAGVAPPSPARSSQGAPQSAARPRPDAPPGSARAVATPVVAAAAQALVRLLASL